MTEATARNMAESENRSASNARQLAHARPVVERCLTWSGLLPLPSFLALHVASELRLAFSSDVSEVLRRPPGSFVELTSLLLVWLPLGVHLGAVATLVARRRSPRRLPSDVPALARSLSRVSAAMALLFLVYHAHSLVWPVWLGQAAAEDRGFRLAAELATTSGGVPLNGAFYLLGLIASVTHAALGVHRGLLAEGLLGTAERRRNSARACTVLAALLFCAGAAAVIRVATGVLLG